MPKASLVRCQSLTLSPTRSQEQRSCEPPGPNEVQIAVQATGLCGSDLHYYKHGRNGDFALRHPMCLGHESAGQVVAIGSDVKGIPVGARVAIEAGLYCRNCPRCEEGRYNLCPSMRFASSAKTHPHLDGTLQSLLNWPSWGVHPLPTEVSYEQGALIEPLSVVLQGIQRCNLTKGETVLVLGAGAVGLLACAAAKGAGAKYVVAVDIDAGRLDFAKRQGWADETYTLPRTAPVPGEEPAATMAKAQQMAQQLVGSLSSPHVGAAKGTGAAFDVIFECSGVPSCVQLGIYATRPGGRVVLIGMGVPIQTMPIGAAALREVDILGVFRYAHTYPRAIEMLSSGELNGIESVISHRYKLEEANEAFETLANGRSGDGKGVTKVFVTAEAEGAKAA